MTVSIVGELNVDIILRGIDGFPELDKEKLASEGKITLGSSSAICAVGLSRLGVKVNFVGAVGEDILGEYILRFLNKEKINIERVKRINIADTGFTVSLTYTENRALITYTGIMDDFTVDDADREFIYNSSDHIHISSYFLQKSLQGDIESLFISAKERGITISLDPGWDPEDKNWNKLFNLFPIIDILFVNELEQSSIDMIAEVISNDVKTLVIKLGEKGALAVVRGKKYFRPSFKVNVVDTTGAGDSFNAGFLYGRLNGYDIDRCLLLGNACGALSCTGIGGTTMLPTLKGLRDFLESNLSQNSI